MRVKLGLEWNLAVSTCRSLIQPLDIPLVPCFFEIREIENFDIA